MRRPLVHAAGLACLACVVLGGCAHSIAQRMVKAPNYDQQTFYPAYISMPNSVGNRLEPYDRVLRLRRMPVEYGAVSLRMLVIEPSDAPFVHVDPDAWWWASPPTPREPVGTLILLHGMWGSIDYLVDHGVAFANAGWRVVLLELRGHGESTGAMVTYGNRESRDVIEALQRLQADGTLRPPVALVGWSLGGSTAIMAAGRGAPVDAVVAIAPFARVRDVAPNFAEQFGGWFSWLATAGLADRVVTLAGIDAGFDPFSDSPMTLAPQVHQPLLLIHGEKDELIPLQQSLLLAQAAGGPVTRVIVPRQDHINEVFYAGLSVPIILDWLRRTPALHQPGDAPLMLSGPLANRPGEADAGIATWMWRAQVWDTTGPWARPVGVRRLRLWPAIPPAWLYRDLDIDIGTILQREETRYNGVVIGSTPFVGPLTQPRSRRYRIPGWLHTPRGELTIRLESTDEDSGVVWPGGAPLLQPAVER